MVTTVRGASVNRLQPTAPFEESPKVAKTLVDLAKRAQEGGASSIMFFPQKNVKFEAYAFAYHTNLAKEMNIAKPPTGAIRGTVVINISGHATGSLTDRVVAFAEKSIAAERGKIGDDATKFVALRTAVDKAVRELQSDYQRTKTSATIDLSAILGDGKSLELTREKLDTLQKAPNDSQIAVDGNRALRKFFASTNTYNVRIRTPDGKTIEQRNIERNNPGRIEYSTRIPVEIPEGTKGEVVLEAWPTGSAEVAGYVEARRYKIHVGEGLFDLDKAIEAAKKYQQAHPEIRWDTEHEDEDLEKNHVSPSPYPYQDF
jgi:hypothetical protein